jgi:hypothetical protein
MTSYRLIRYFAKEFYFLGYVLMNLFRFIKQSILILMSLNVIICSYSKVFVWHSGLNGSCIVDLPWIYKA